MTWDSFDAEWSAEDVSDVDADLPCLAAYTRDDGIRLEFYVWEGRRIVEVSDAAGDVLGKLEFIRSGDARLVGTVEGWEHATVWHDRPTVRVAAVRFAAVVWP